MALDVFDIKLGTDTMPDILDDETKGFLAVQMLDAVQTVVDVLTDNDGKGGWRVTFDPGINAYTDRSATRHIVVSGKPLLDAKGGDPLAFIAAVMTGFAVHEVGHTKINFYEAIVKRWPGKQLPITLGNIIEDVVLELQAVARYPGFADNGDGNIFYPTLAWVAERTCPTTPLEWNGSTGHRVNVTGQILRYRDFVTFANDAVTQAALTWVATWGQRMTADLTPSGCVALIEEWLDYVQSDGSEPKPPTPPTPPPTTECEFPFGENKTPAPTPSIPDEDDDDETEPKGSGGDQPGEGGDEPGGDTEGGDQPGEGKDDGGNGTEGGDGEGKSDGPTTDGGDGEGRPGDGNDADTLTRVDAKQGTNDGPGGGGTGQSVSEAGEDTGDPDPDHGFNLDEVDDSFDSLAKVGEDYGSQGQQRRLDVAEKTERATVRMDAGAFGKMRVIWK